MAENELTGWFIYVQSSLCNKFVPISMHSQTEVRDIAKGYVIGSLLEPYGIGRQLFGELTWPFLASEAKHYRLKEVLEEIAKSDYALSTEFDPVIFAMRLWKSSKLEHLAEFEAGLKTRFHMEKVVKKD
ncbi:MAG: hypothetical protein AABX27_01045 [Nanoarchaeota archaeon]